MKIESLSAPPNYSFEIATSRDHEAHKRVSLGVMRSRATTVSNILKRIWLYQGLPWRHAGEGRSYISGPGLRMLGNFTGRIGAQSCREGRQSFYSGIWA